MRAFLLSISLLLTCLLPSFAQTEDGVASESYKVSINARGQEISGLAIMEPQADKSILGAIVNDFGVKVYDFVYSNGKTKISNVIAPLNKWYIRKVLRKDLSYILLSLSNDADPSVRARMSKAKRSTEKRADGTLTLTNHRYNIVYVLSPMNENDDREQ